MTPADFFILLSWAVLLSPYKAPAGYPDIAFVPHAYLEARACGGRSCGVIGWYDDAGTIYLDSEQPVDCGIVLHEAVHWLQHMSGRYDPASCADSIKREREAYALQDEYETRTGGMVKPHPVESCIRLMAAQ